MAICSIHRDSRISPFCPGDLVAPEFFAGRGRQLAEFQRRALQVLSGRMESLFLSGVRGIGKSSLARCAGELVRRELNMLVVHVMLCGVTTIEELTRRVFGQLLKEAYPNGWNSKVNDILDDYSGELECCRKGRGFFPSGGHLHILAQEFPEALRRLFVALQGIKSGVVVILDDFESLAGQASFANWYKGVVDSVAAQQWSFPALLILAGTPDQRENLAHVQPSLLRVLRVVDLERLSDNEVMQFFQHAYSVSGIRAEQASLEVMTHAALGFPTLMQEIGDAVFWADNDKFISRDDVAVGLHMAAEVVRKKYFEPQCLPINGGEDRGRGCQHTLWPTEAEFLRSANCLLGG